MKKFFGAVLVFFFALQAFCAPDALATAVTASRANDADDLANGAAFDNLGAWVLTVADDASFTNGVITTAGNGGANAGTVTFAGTSTLNTAASANVLGVTANRLLAVNAGVAGETVTLNGDSWSTNFNVTGTGTVNADAITATTLNFAADGILSLDTTENITAAITNTTTSNGTLILEGAHTITGDIGSTGAGLKLITAGNGAVVTTGDIKATTLNFAGDNTLTLATTKSITGAITATTTNTGTLIMTNVGTVTGTVGSSSAALKLITLSGAGAKAITGNVYATTTNFGSTGTLTMSDDASINGLISTDNAGQGNLTFSGTSTVTGAIGSNANFLNTITANGASETLTFGGNVFAIDITQGAANTLNIGANTVDLVEASGDGDLTMNANGTLALRINSASVFGNIQATGGTGTAIFAATNTINVTVAGAVANGTTFAIVNSTDDGVAAVPGTVTDNSPFVSFAVTEPTAGDLVLTATTTTSTVGTTGNSSTALTAVNNALSTNASADFTSAMGSLFSITDTAAATTAVESLDPAVDGAITQGSFNTQSQSLGAFTSHMDNVRTGVNAGETGLSAGDGFQNMTFWLKGIGNYTDQDRRKGVDGYDAATGGVAGGLDGQVSENYRIGVGGGWAFTDVDGDSEPTGANVESPSVTLYGMFDHEPYFVDWAFSYARNSYETSRTITFANRTAEGDFDGNQYTGLIGGGYTFKHEGWELVPLASLQYSHLDVDDYTETGAGSLNLIVEDQSYDFLQSGLGAKVAYPFTNDSGTWIPEVHAKWLYDFIGDQVQTTSTFTGGGSSFSTNGLEPAQSSLNLGAGLTLATKGTSSFILNYDAELKDDFVSHSGTFTWKCQY